MNTNPVFSWAEAEDEQSAEMLNLIVLAGKSSDSAGEKGIFDRLLHKFSSKRTIHIDENVNVFSLVLKAYQGDGTHPYDNRHYWQHTEIVFHTESSVQTLQIVMHSPQADNGVSRFHLHSINEESHRLDVIDEIVHYSLKDDAAGPWHPLKKDATFPAHTKRIKLKLHLPGDKEQYFALKMRAKDIRDAHPFNCDPQVGNDPPRPDI